jgi:hypothetical protein
LLAQVLGDVSSRQVWSVLGRLEIFGPAPPLVHQRRPRVARKAADIVEIYLHPHSIPTRARWLNQVERWFSILSRQKEVE